MDGVAEVEQHVRAAEAVFEVAQAETVRVHLGEFLGVAGGLLMEQAVVIAQAVLQEPLAEGTNAGSILLRIVAGGQNLQPHEMLAQAFEAERPLQRYGEVAAAEPVLSGKSAAQENGRGHY